MPIARVERRLAAILAADIVGYSRLIETDEARTLAAITALRSQVLDPLIADHGGRAVKRMVLLPLGEKAFAFSPPE